MRKAPLVLAAAAVLGLTAVAAPSPAEARYWRGGGGGFFPAVAGGLIAGAVIGGHGVERICLRSRLRIL